MDFFLKRALALLLIALAVLCVNCSFANETHPFDDEEWVEFRTSSHWAQPFRRRNSFDSTGSIHSNDSRRSHSSQLAWLSGVSSLPDLFAHERYPTLGIEPPDRPLSFAITSAHDIESLSRASSMASSSTGLSQEGLSDNDFFHRRQLGLMVLHLGSIASFGAILNHRNIREIGLGGKIMMDIAYDSWRQVRSNTRWGHWSTPWIAAPTHFIPNVVTNILANYDLAPSIYGTIIIASVFSTCVEYICNYRIPNFLSLHPQLSDRGARMLGKSLEGILQTAIGVSAARVNIYFEENYTEEDINVRLRLWGAVILGAAFYIPKVYFEFRDHPIQYYNRVSALPFLFGVMHLLENHAGRY